MPTWREWQDSPWGRLRYAVAEANLARHLPPTPLRVLDLAGGDGADAIRLAARGHHVTIVDHSPDMLTAARTRADEAALTTRITCVESDIHALPPSEHDVVLCHNVLPYVDEPRATLAAALTHLRPGGVLSVMAVNRHSAPLVAAIRHLDPEAALAALDEPRARTELFDRHITLHTAEEITETLTALGCPPRPTTASAPPTTTSPTTPRSPTPPSSRPSNAWNWPSPTGTRTSTPPASSTWSPPSPTADPAEFRSAVLLGRVNVYSCR